MNQKFKEIAKKRKIYPYEWKELVSYLNNDEKLALATRIFYILNPHSTHPFDYFVPKRISTDSNKEEMKVINDYLTRAGLFKSCLRPHCGVSDIYYFAAELIGQLYEI